MINLNRPTLSPGKLDATDFDQLQPAEACTELGAEPGDFEASLAMRLRWWIVVAGVELAGMAWLLWQWVR